MIYIDYSKGKISNLPHICVNEMHIIHIIYISKSLFAPLKMATFE